VYGYIILTKEHEPEIESSKYCPKCNGDGLLLLRSLYKKICVDCDTEIPWYLKYKQKSLIQHQR